MQRAHTRSTQSRQVHAGLSAHGFSLIELMITLAVLAVVLAIAFPSFTAIINGSRLTSTTNELISSIQIARMEAIRRNTRVFVCNSTNGTSCAGSAAGTNWTNWIVLVPDGNGDGTANDALVVRTGSATNLVEVRSSAALTQSSIVFRPDGLGRPGNAPTGALANAAIQICVPKTRPAENQRIVTLATGSRISTAVASGGGLCGTPADPT